jgi:hypothetical protein
MTAKVQSAANDDVWIVGHGIFPSFQSITAPERFNIQWVKHAEPNAVIPEPDDLWRGADCVVPLFD